VRPPSVRPARRLIAAIIIASVLFLGQRPRPALFVNRPVRGQHRKLLTPCWDHGRALGAAAALIPGAAGSRDRENVVNLHRRGRVRRLSSQYAFDR
jgi:hypothetical protein